MSEETMFDPAIADARNTPLPAALKKCVSLYQPATGFRPGPLHPTKYQPGATGR